jgi:cell wall-associated NlpC family hydrolase
VSYARVIVRIVLYAVFVVGLVSATAAPVAADTAPLTQFDQVANVAESKIGDPWVHFAKGPDKFDCVGFVWYAFHEKGLEDLIGGYRGVKAYYNWFQARGLASRTDPQPGDLIIWGKFEHIGIYLGGGQAISALINPYGVKIHPVTGYIHMAVKAYLHTNLQH